ncbi:MAG: FAD:protein FMN transferase [Thermodesulfobacteriota bacterium]
MLFSLTAIAFLAVAVKVDAVMVTEQRVVMGTKLEMTISVDNEVKAERAFDAVEAEFKRIENEMSEWREGSLVSLINRNAGKKTVKVTDELFNVIHAAVEISRLTEGAFDISWAAMHGLWDFRPGRERLPDKEEIEARLPLINYRSLELDPASRSVYLKKAGMKIGLGGIAKGYAVDRAAELLSGMGIDDMIIKAGGDMRVQGNREGGGPWKISIKHPRKKEPLARLPLTNISISTSGDYEHFFIQDGVLYHHIIDPRLGYPARGCQSVTVLAPDTMTSDALSTAFFVLGPEVSIRLANLLNGIEAIIVDSSGAVLTSGGIDIKEAVILGKFCYSREK